MGELATYEQKFARLHCDRPGGRPRPHKAVMLLPFSLSKDDRPQNGIALCKNHHWLMDHAIIAPGPGSGGDYQRPVWHVRNGLDDRLEEHRPVLELRYKTVILPAQVRYAPVREAVDWRMERLQAM